VKFVSAACTCCIALLFAGMPALSWSADEKPEWHPPVGAPAAKGGTSAADLPKPTEEMKAAAKAKEEARKAEMRKEPRVDINNASRAEISKVLGISDADAGKIIAARPLRARTDIVTKAGLPEGVYIAVRSRIIINEPRKPGSKK